MYLLSQFMFVTLTGEEYNGQCSAGPRAGIRSRQALVCSKSDSQAWHGERPFLLFMLRNFGFSEGVMDLLFQTFSNSWFLILVNGQPAKFFKSRRGVRQGNPLSPALFLFVAEFLGQGLQEFCRTQMDSCYILAGIKEPYLAFANDTIIFTRCSDSCLSQLLNFLLLYQKYSGQKVNVDKCAFLASSRITEDQCRFVVLMLGFHK